MVCWQLLNSSRSPLVALTQLKKICDHPRLLSLRQCHKLGLNLGDDGSVSAQQHVIAPVHAHVCFTSS